MYFIKYQNLHFNILVCFIRISCIFQHTLHLNVIDVRYSVFNFLYCILCHCSHLDCLQISLHACIIQCLSSSQHCQAMQVELVVVGEGDLLSSIRILPQLDLLLDSRILFSHRWMQLVVFYQIPLSMGHLIDFPD